MSNSASNPQMNHDDESHISEVSTLSSAPRAAGSDLQQIQDLLFGAQAREIEGKLQSLEHHFNGRLEQLTQSFDAQIETLSSLLAEQGEKERSERQLGHEVVAKSVEDLRANLSGALSDLSAQQQQAQREIAQELQASNSQLAEKMAQQNEQLMGQFQRGQSELEKDKMSKKAMAKLLNDLAAGL